MRSKREIRGIVDGFAKSGMTRRDYCEKHNIGISTLDYWRRTQKSKPRLVEVTVETPPGTGFALVLANGRRIESSWKFAEAELIRLIRAAEA
jgi:hypothetical protein